MTFPYPAAAAHPQAKWVWFNDCQTSNGPATITITQKFRLACDGPVTLYATADNTFIAYINGI